MSHLATIGSRNGFMSNAELLAVAPSMFAKHAMPGVSDAYQFARTIDVVDTLRLAGYEPVKAGQAKARVPGGAEYTRHEVRLMHRDYLDPANRKAGDVVPQVLLRNSHDRTSAFQMGAGLFRLVCSNGLAVSVAELAGLRVLHNDKNLHDHIIDGTNLIREVTETVITPQVEAMTRMVLTKAMARDFAEAATYFKFGEVKADHVDPFLAAHRAEDEGYDLWRVLNRIQENAVRGGYEAKDVLGRNVKARPITNIARDVDFNLNLWSLGAKVLELA